MRYTIPKMDDGKTLALSVHIEGDPTSHCNCYHVRLHACCINPADNRPDTPLGAVWGIDSYGEASKLDGLIINSQGGNDSQPRRLYAQQCEYRDVYSVELRDAEKMFCVLRHIEKRLEKRKEEEGHPATFGQYCGRVAKALGIKQILVPKTDENGGQVMEQRRNGYKYDVQSVGRAVENIDHIVSKWAKCGEGEE